MRAEEIRGEQGAMVVASQSQKNYVVGGVVRDAKGKVQSSSMLHLDVERLVLDLRSNETGPCLDFSFVPVSGEDAVLIADALAVNTSLKRLTLPNLMEERHSVAFGAALEQNSGLEMLDAEGLLGNLIGNEGATAFAGGLERNTCLKELDLRECTIGEEGAERIGWSLQSNSTLTVLNMSGNSVGHAGGLGIAKGLALNQSLVELDLRRCSMTAAGIVPIGVALATNTTLERLYLQENNVGDHGTWGVAKGLIENVSPKLKALEMCHCCIGELGAKALGRALAVNTSLETLDLEHNSFGERDGIISIAGGLQLNASLTNLNLLGCKIETFGCEAIGRAIAENTRLAALNLNDNPNMECWGAIGISEGLSLNSSLKELRLKGCRIGKGGGTALGKALGQNACLETLDLGSNRLVDCGEDLSKGLAANTVLKRLDLNSAWLMQERAGLASDCGAIGDALALNSTLQWLDVSGTRMFDVGAAKFAAGLSPNSSLIHLKMSYNGIGLEGAKKLASALEQNTHLQGLMLDQNQVSDEGVTRIAEVLGGGNSTLSSLSLCIDGWVVDEAGESAVRYTYDKGAMALAAALRNNHGLVNLNLSSETSKAISKDIVAEFGRAIRMTGGARQGRFNLIGRGIRLKEAWKELGLSGPNEGPTENSDIINQWHETDRGKIQAFAMGLHQRLGRGAGDDDKGCVFNRMQPEIFGLVCKAFWGLKWVDMGSLSNVAQE